MRVLLARLLRPIVVEAVRDELARRDAASRAESARVAAWLRAEGPAAVAGAIAEAQASGRLRPGARP